jgi:hypothetical protein
VKEHVAATLLAMTAACGCEHHEPAGSNDPIPIACVLSALSEDQRAPKRYFRRASRDM